MELPSDQELMRLTALDDRHAFEVLVLRHREKAQHYCQGLIHDADMAQDIVQDSFADVYVQRAAYRSDFSFTTYLYTLIRHKAVDYLRKNGRMEVTEDERLQLAMGTGGSPEELFIAKEYKNQVRKWLELLPPNHRQALYYYCVDELSYDEIAGKMGKSVAQIKIYIHRARKKLQKQKGEKSDE